MLKRSVCLTWWALMVFPGLPVGLHCLGLTVGRPTTGCHTRSGMMVGAPRHQCLYQESATNAGHGKALAHIRAKNGLLVQKP